MFGGQDGLRRMMSQDAIKPKNTGATLARFAGYFKPYWAIMLLVAILIVVSTWAQVKVPQLIGQAVDCYLVPVAQPALGNFLGVTLSQSSSTGCTYASGTATMTNEQKMIGLLGIILRITVLFVLSSILTGLMFYLMTWAGQHALKQIRVDLFKHLHDLSMKFYSEHEAGDLMSRITNDSDTIQQAFNFALVNVLSGALLLVWIAYAMFNLDALYALLSLSIVPIMIIVTVWFSSQARKAFRRTRLEIGNVNAELQENISSVREVQAFSREDENLRSFQITNAANRDANVRAVAFTSALAPSLEALGYAALAIVTCVGGLLLLRGQTLFGTTVSLGLIIAFIGYVQRFTQPIQGISILWTNIQSAIAGGERIFSMLDTQPDLQDAPDSKPMPPIRGQVEFKDVTAGYKAGLDVLNGINFTADPGKTIAIVGPTGAGKTTMINLIPRFLDVNDGVVLIDDVDVRTVTQKSLREQIGLVLQDTFLFSTTIMENIRFGRPDATDEEVQAAARLAHADTFIERLQDGYQTVLGERGSGLSQGQRQLIAIARAALAQPKILILDEATSSVDLRTERLIQQALQGLLQGRTSFVIAHRLSTIRNADLVLVLDQGNIVECGKHDELLAQKGFYYDLYMSQFRRRSEMDSASKQSLQPGENLQSLSASGA